MRRATIPEIAGFETIKVLDAPRNTVVRAHHRSSDGPSDRTVVIKILDRAKEPVLPKRFNRSRRTLVGMCGDDRGFVPLLDADVSGEGFDYIVSPYYPIGSLQDQIDQGPTPWHLAADLVAKVAEIISAAHDESIVLGDIRPSNILLEAAGKPLVAAMGMATRRFDDGTPDFAAPESEDDRTRLTPAGDVYSLALVFGALIAGRAKQRGQSDADFLDELAELVPARVLDVVEHGLAHSPTNRYRNAGTMGRAIRAAIDADPDELTAQPTVEGSADPLDVEEILSELGDDAEPETPPAATVEPLPPGLEDIVFIPREEPTAAPSAGDLSLPAGLEDLKLVSRDGHGPDDDTTLVDVDLTVGENGSGTEDDPEGVEGQDDPAAGGELPADPDDGDQQSDPEAGPSPSPTTTTTPTSTLIRDETADHQDPDFLEAVTATMEISVDAARADAGDPVDGDTGEGIEDADETKPIVVLGDDVHPGEPTGVADLDEIHDPTAILDLDELLTQESVDAAAADDDLPIHEAATSTAELDETDPGTGEIVGQPDFDSETDPGFEPGPAVVDLDQLLADDVDPIPPAIDAPAPPVLPMARPADHHGRPVVFADDLTEVFGRADSGVVSDDGVPAEHAAAAEDGEWAEHAGAAEHAAAAEDGEWAEDAGAAEDAALAGRDDLAGNAAPAEPEDFPEHNRLAEDTAKTEHGEWAEDAAPAGHTASADGELAKDAAPARHTASVEHTAPVEHAGFGEEPVMAEDAGLAEHVGLADDGERARHDDGSAPDRDGEPEQPDDTSADDDQLSPDGPDRRRELVGAGAMAAAPFGERALSADDIPFTGVSRVRQSAEPQSWLQKVRVAVEVAWFRSRRSMATMAAVLGLVAIAGVAVFFVAKEIQSSETEAEGVPHTPTTATSSPNYVATDTPYVTDPPQTHTTTTTTTAPPRRRRTTTEVVTTTTAATNPAPPSTVEPSTTRSTIEVLPTIDGSTTNPPTTSGQTVPPDPTTPDTTVRTRPGRGRPTRTTTIEIPSTTEEPTTTTEDPPPTTDDDDDDDSGGDDIGPAEVAADVPRILSLDVIDVDRWSASVSYASDRCVATQFSLSGTDGTSQQGSSPGFDPDIRCSKAWNLDFDGSWQLKPSTDYVLQVWVRSRSGGQTDSAQISFSTPS